MVQELRRLARPSMRARRSAARWTRADRPRESPASPIAQIVDGHRELIRPVTIAVPQQEVAALVRRAICSLRPKQPIGERLGTGVDRDAQPAPGVLDAAACGMSG